MKLPLRIIFGMSGIKSAERTESSFRVASSEVEADQAWWHHHIRNRIQGRFPIMWVFSQTGAASFSRCMSRERVGYERP